MGGNRKRWGLCGVDAVGTGLAFEVVGPGATDFDSFSTNVSLLGASWVSVASELGVCTGGAVGL